MDILARIKQQIGYNETKAPWPDGMRTYWLDGKTSDWAVQGYWVEAESFEAAKLIFERYQKLKAFW